MYVTFEEYTNLGFNKVPEAEFPRFELKAQMYVDSITLNRLRCPHAELSELNKIGICEIIDVIYVHDKKMQAIESDIENNCGKELVSFRNDEYSENYNVKSAAQYKSDLDLKLSEFNNYFTLAQRSRVLGCNLCQCCKINCCDCGC